jgi:tetratricopeptide (TPR) repeat protein
LGEGIRTLDVLVAKENGSARGQYIVPYAAYLATRDTTYLAAVLRWAGTPTNDFPELRALAALQRKDTATAMQLARAFAPPDSIQRRPLSLNGARVLVRASVLAELGDLRAAVAMYEAVVPSQFYGDGAPELLWPVYLRSYVARARLYEQLGEPDKAIAAYETFLRYWTTGEAPVQSQLRDAREAIARLKDASRATTPRVTRGK